MTTITVNGHDYNDASYDVVTNPLGLGNGGHRYNLLNMLLDLMADATRAVRATSVSSVAIGLGSKSFTLSSAVTFGIGAWVNIASSASPSNYMVGQVTAQAGTALTVSVTQIGGSGTIAAWDIQTTGLPSSAFANPESIAGKVASLSMFR